MVYINTVCTWLRTFVASSALSRLRTSWGGTLGPNLLVGGTQTFLRTGTATTSTLIQNCLCFLSFFTGDDFFNVTFCILFSQWSLQEQEKRKKRELSLCLVRTRDVPVYVKLVLVKRTEKVTSSQAPRCVSWKAYKLRSSQTYKSTSWKIYNWQIDKLKNW